MGLCGAVQAVASSFGFNCPPKVNLNLDSSAAKFRKKGPKVEGRSIGKHGFNASNPYGKKAGGGATKFTRF